MCQLLETIKIENGHPCNLPYHSRRMNIARAELFGLSVPINLANCLTIPNDCKNGLYRCRLLYREQIESVEFIPQPARQFRSLKVIRCNNLDYHLKYADRTRLNELFAQREDADEVIIVQNGLVTDCTIANLVFFDGEKWLTPDTPLLQGTQRQRLLDDNIILKTRISEKDLSRFEEVGLINAFFDLSNMPVIKRTNIF